MAKWVAEGKPPFTGTVDGLTIYQLPDDKWYVRMKSSITGKRIKKDKAFEGFRKSAVRMKDASPIASKVYRQLPVKEYRLFREMTGKALLWLKAGLTVDVITDKLMEEYMPVNLGAGRSPACLPQFFCAVAKPQRKKIANLSNVIKLKKLKALLLSPPLSSCLRPTNVLYTAYFNSGTLYQINNHQQTHQKYKTSQ